ncbi:MAG: outer membrane beta-barrel protein [Vicinamibacterales bacterium]
MRVLQTTGVVLAVVLGLAALPGVAAAQTGIGIGPRITFVRGDASTPDGSTRFSGGALRLGSGAAAVELAIDYRNAVNDDLTERVKDFPFQASVLVYPIRAAVSPYLVGGLGWYSQRVDSLGAGQAVLETTTTRKMGWHAGVGGEIRLHPRVSLFGDYRYTFIRFGGADDSTQPPLAPESSGTTITPLPGFIPFADRLKLSHQGSMWTWGAIFRF